MKKKYQEWLNNFYKEVEPKVEMSQFEGWRLSAFEDYYSDNKLEFIFFYLFDGQQMFDKWSDDNHNYTWTEDICNLLDDEYGELFEYQIQEDEMVFEDFHMAMHDLFFLCLDDDGKVSDYYLEVIYNLYHELIKAEKSDIHVIENEFIQEVKELQGELKDIDKEIKDIQEGNSNWTITYE